MSQIAFDGITKIYGEGDKGVLAVDRLSLEVGHGEFLVFVGPSGCGKSTALRMVAGLEDITEGELRIDGERVNEREPAERDIAMVFQNYALYPHMSVYRNIAYPLRIQKESKAVIDERVRETARILQLTDLLDRKPGALSGGQRQRVAMGRALIRQPRAFLMDEPLSNLDATLRVQMRSEITSIQRQIGVTTIYVTHDQIEAMTMGDRVAVMRDGTLQQVATPEEIFWRPRNTFVAAFIGSPPMNLFESAVEIVADGIKLNIGSQTLSIGSSTMERHQGLAAFSGDKVIAGIRPEHLTVSSSTTAEPALHGRVVMTEQLGTEVMCYVDIGTETLTEALDSEVESDLRGDPSAGALIARIRSRTTPHTGETISLTVDVDELRFFCPETTNAI